MALAAAAPARPSFLLGAALILAAGLSWSFSGLFVRLTPAMDAWQFLALRGLGVATVFVLLARWSGAPSILRDLVALGRTGALVTAAFLVASMGYIVALKLTTVANVLVLSSTAPLFAAVLGYVALGEKLNSAQGGAVALGFVGLMVTVRGGFEAGGWIGNTSALLSSLGFAVASVAMRRDARGADFKPTAACYGLLTAIIASAVCLIGGKPIAPSLFEGAIAFAAGFVIIGLGFSLFLRGAPAVPAVGQTVLAQTETVFGPLWPWLAFGETPAAATLIGGAIILCAVVAMTAAGAQPPAPNVSN